MTTRIRLPRHHRSPFQRLALPTWLRVIVITLGWLMVLVGIAGAGDDHLDLLGQIAVVFMDEEGIGKLEAATTAEQIMDVFSDVEL